MFIAAIRSYNVEVSAGQFGGVPAVKGQRLNASIIVQNLLKTPEEFGAIPHPHRSGRVHRARARRGTDRAGHRALRQARADQRQARDRAGVRQAAGANALDTAKAIKAKMAELSNNFPPGMVASYPYDTTPS